MVLGRKAYGIFKSRHSQSFLDSICTSGQSSAQGVLSNKTSTLRETEKARSSAQGFSSQSPLPTTRQEHGTDPKRMYLHRNYYGRTPFGKQSDTCLEVIGMRLGCKGIPLLRNRPATRTFCFRPNELKTGVNIWWNTGTIHPKITSCRTRRDQTRTFCTLRYRTGRKDYSSSPILVKRCFSNNYTDDTLLFKSKEAYYDILEVSPTATQVQIKTAYYKQSFIYHPDKNAGSEQATRRFSQISEAYIVLGNKSLRKKYDLGILTQTDLLRASRPSAKETSGSSTGQQTKSRSSSVAGIDSKNVYNFDNFIKSYYSEQLQRDRDIRSRQEELQRKKHQSMEGRKLGDRAEMYVGLLIAMALALIVSVKYVK